MHGTSSRIALKHYLITIGLDPSTHFHCYLVTDDKRYLQVAADQLLTEAEKLGCSHPTLGIVLATRLVDDVAAVRAIIRKREPQQAAELFATITDFHWSFFVTCADDPADAQLLAMH